MQRGNEYAPTTGTQPHPRAAHYQELANKLRQMAEAEPSNGDLRARLLTLAADYQKLATGVRVVRRDG